MTKEIHQKRIKMCRIYSLIALHLKTYELTISITTNGGSTTQFLYNLGIMSEYYVRNRVDTTNSLVN